MEKEKTRGVTRFFIKHLKKDTWWLNLELIKMPRKQEKENNKTIERGEEENKVMRHLEGREQRT